MGSGSDLSVIRCKQLPSGLSSSSANRPPVGWPTRSAAVRHRDSTDAALDFRAGTVEARGSGARSRATEKGTGMTKRLTLGLTLGCLLTPLGAQGPDGDQPRGAEGVGASDAAGEDGGRAGRAGGQLRRDGRSPDRHAAPVDPASLRRAGPVGAARRLHHRRRPVGARRRARLDARRRLPGAGALPGPRSLHHPDAGTGGPRGLYQRHHERRFAVGEVLLRQRHHGRQDSGVGRGRGDPEGQRRHHRPVRPSLRPPGRQPGRRRLRRFPPLPDRADRVADRRPRLFRDTGHERRLQSRTDRQPHRQPLLPERAHDLRHHGRDPPGDPGAVPLSAEPSCAGPNTATTAS